MQELKSYAALLEENRLLKEQLRVISTLNEDQSLNRYKIAYDHLPVAAAITRLSDGMYIDVNPWFSDLTGYAKEELVGKSSLSLNIWVHTYEREGLVDILSKEGRVFNYAASFRYKNGSEHRGLMTAHIIPMVDDEKYLFSFTHDIEEHERHKEELVYNQKRWRTLVQNAPQIINIIDREGTLLFSNHSPYVIGKSVFEMLLPQYRDALKNTLKKVFEYASTERLVFQGRRSELEPVLWYEGFVGPIVQDGEVKEAVAVSSDITHLKRTEQRLQELTKNLQLRVEREVASRREKEKMLIEQSKMAAMGEMLGAIAHQWRQPLNALALQVQDITDAYNHDELDYDYCVDLEQKAMHNIAFMSRTIDDFRNFFKPSKEQVTFDLINVIQDVEHILSAQLTHHHIELKTQFTGRKFKLTGYANEFKQVVLNILNNAKDAILEHHIKHGEIHIILEWLENETVKLIISDNGGGIPESVLYRIFEPYFSTKKLGTGIGLYMSKTIIEENMGGSLTVENCNEGACFTIMLPKEAKAPSETD